MANLQKHALSAGTFPMPTGSESEVVSVRAEITLSANPVANDVISMCILPPDHIPVDCILDADDLDTNGAPTITISVGIMNAAETDLLTDADSGGGLWISASNVAQAGGLVRPTTVFIKRVNPKSVDRKVGLKFPAVSATFAAGKIGLEFSYRPAYQGK